MKKKSTPIKNLIQNQNDISKKKIFLFQHYKPINIRQVSSQFRECNKRYFPNHIEQKDDEKKIKQKNININYIKNNNFFRLNSSSKYKITLSQEKERENKNKKIHEENLKKMKELQKILDDLKKNNISLSNDIDKLNNEENNLKNDLHKKDDEEKELTAELDNLKNTNEEKNREYLHLQQMNHHQQIENPNNNNNALNNNNNNRQRIQNINNNNSENNNEEVQANEIDLLNRLLRLHRQVVGLNREGNGEENILGDSLNASNYDQIELLNEDLGPPMSMEQIEALPNEKYPKKDTYDEKCILCGFNIYYNDLITKLQQCQHIFHKECFTNFLIHKQASKCPICKVSLI